MSDPRRLRAPRQNGAVVAEPPLSEAATLLAANRQRLSRPAAGVLGQSWDDLRRLARRTTLQAARAYLEHAGEPVPSFPDTSLVVAGHQPELFHPGVWVKNFALNGLAQAQQITPINLVVDNDTAKSTALRLPAPPNEEVSWPHLVSVPFDRWTGEVPYEERAVQDEAMFAALPSQATPLLNSWGFAPFLSSYWEEVRRQRERTPLLGERLVAARRTFERRWGCHNLEVPVSWLCRTEPFAWFACHLLMHLPRFHALYNACVHDYRRQYGIRSRNHPVPDLTREGDWLELPFWAWHTGQAQRGRLLARHTETRIDLRAGKEQWPALPKPTTSGPSSLIRAWQELEARGFKVRSRALTNTLFARLFVADLFIHGIGGGKYDELTDALARRFYECEPPGFLVLSATLLLPLPVYPARPETCRRLSRQLRDLHYNPQRHLPESVLTTSAIRDLMAQKQAWIDRQPPTAGERRGRFQMLRALTEQLRPQLADQEKRVRQELARCEQEVQANAVLQRRDYAFCLHPESLLKPFCKQFLAAGPSLRPLVEQEPSGGNGSASDGEE